MDVLSDIDAGGIALVIYRQYVGRRQHAAFIGHVFVWQLGSEQHASRAIIAGDAGCQMEISSHQPIEHVVFLIAAMTSGEF